jgi:hypothetical protein
MRTSFVSIAVGSINNRLSDLKQTDPNIAADIMTTTQSTHAHLLHILDGEFLIMLDRFSRRADFTNDSWMPLYFRAGRKDALLSLLDDRQELQFINDQTSMAWARSSEAKLRVARGDMFYLSIIPKPSMVVRGFFMPNYWIISREHKTALHGRLLAAELQGQPWPIDTFDATGSVLRPITRDGRIIAAYSVGDDGIDQGGNEKKDHVFPLYAKP